MKVIHALLVGMLFAQPLMAGDEHGHNHEASVEAAPHGGVLRDAGMFKSELVLNGDVAKVYVYDKNLKPVKLTEASLKGDVQFPKKKAKKVTFKKVGDTHYEATIAGIGKVHRYDMHVNLVVGKDKVLVDFGIDNIH